MARASNIFGNADNIICTLVKHLTSSPWAVLRESADFGPKLPRWRFPKIKAFFKRSFGYRPTSR
jgi:hypothetical protein